MSPRPMLPLALAAALLAGCATTNRVAISPAAAADLDHTPGHVVVPSPEIAARIPGSNVAGASIAACSAVPGGFLVGAIIGAASSGVDSAIENRQAKSAEALVTPIRDVLTGLDTPQEIVAALQAALAADTRFGPDQLLLERQTLPDKKVIQAWVEAAPHKTLLLIRCDYYFTPDFGRIALEATSDVITADPKLRGQATKRFLPYPSVYHNFFSTGLALAGATGDKEGNAAAWLKHGDALRTELVGAVQELSAMLAYDLGQSTAVTAAGEFKERVQVPMGGGAMVQGGMMQMKAREERRVEGRRWLRAKTGELVSVE